MTMLLITKELAEAVVKRHWAVTGDNFYTCSHCGMSQYRHYSQINHSAECIVIRAKLLLEQEFGDTKTVVEVLKNKYSGEWHVCTLDNRIWRGVEDRWFTYKCDAIKWAKDNGYEVKE